MNHFLIGLILVIGCAGGLQAEEQWQASTLSAETIRKIQSETAKYHHCLGGEVKQFQQKRMDSRDAANLILKRCEAKLLPIRETFLAQNVEIAAVDRYLKRKRHQAARKVLQTMMFAESQRAP